jgi:hypothetical protein
MSEEKSFFEIVAQNAADQLKASLALLENQGKEAKELQKAAYMAIVKFAIIEWGIEEILIYLHPYHQREEKENKGGI